MVVVDKVHAKGAELEGSDLSILYFEIRGCFLVRIPVGNTKKVNRRIVSQTLWNFSLILKRVCVSVCC